MASRKLLRSLSFLSMKSPSPSSSSLSLSRLRPISAFSSGLGSPIRHFSSDEPPSSPPFSPNFRLPKEPLYLPGCDYEHWLVVVDKPPSPPRENIIEKYVKILATVLGSEEVARERIYSVSTQHYFAFGALLTEELAYKLRDVDNVRFVLPDSYLDAENRDYGGEPFIDGEAVPYDSKYHAVWLRNEEKKKGKQQHQTPPQQQGGPQHAASPLGQVGLGGGPNQQDVGSPQGAQFVRGGGPTPNWNNHHSAQSWYQNQQQHSSSANQFGPGPDQFQNDNSGNQDY